MLRKKAKVELIKPVPLFGHFSLRELNDVASLAVEKELPAGYELTTEGAEARDFVVLVDGAADVRRKGRKIGTLEAGEFLGEIALVTGRPRTATVTTTEPTTVLVIAARDFQKLLRLSSSIRSKLLQAVAKRLPQDGDAATRGRRGRGSMPSGLARPTSPGGR
jgi:CRP/FNR family cyclic AMP-dependent transcriptional regulator